MSALRPISAGLVHVLREDPELAESLVGERRERASAECTARELRITPGPWDVDASAIPENGIGLLVLSGLLTRRMVIDGRVGAELLGEGDVLRPWQHDEASTMLSLRADWNVIEPTRMALLDDQFCQLFADYPELASRLFARSVQRSHQLAVQLTIIHHARVDVRLHMLFWHLAGRWGRVRGDGTVVPLRLTHALLSELVAARRPTVSSALSDLARRGLVRPVDDAWLLSGPPPRALAQT